MSDLASRRCVPCRGGVPPLTAAEIEPLLAAAGAKFEVLDDEALIAKTADALAAEVANDAGVAVVGLL